MLRAERRCGRTMIADYRRRCAAEAVGTALLLAAVVGSGIMADRLSNGNQALTLLANSVATGAALVALILTFGPVSGAHFNPAVTLADASPGGLRWRDVPVYLTAQIGGAVVGVLIAHAMFQERVLMLSVRDRSGAAQMFVRRRDGRNAIVPLAGPGTIQDGGSGRRSTIRRRLLDEDRTVCLRPQRRAFGTGASPGDDRVRRRVHL